MSSCPSGPGPAKYLLPPTVGFTGHDGTRDRRPAYSLGRPLVPLNADLGPGSAKYDPNNQTKIGAPHVGAYMGRQFTGPHGTGESPGPGKYLLRTLIGRQRLRTWKQDSPDFSMAQILRAASIAGADGPGPARYQLPNSKMGPEYTMANSLKGLCADANPGPAKYNTRPGFKHIGITMAARLGGLSDGISPGANRYNLSEFKPGKKKPQYSMGRRLNVNFC